MRFIYEPDIDVGTFVFIDDEHKSITNTITSSVLPFILFDFNGDTLVDIEFWDGASKELDIDGMHRMNFLEKENFDFNEFQRNKYVQIIDSTCAV